MPSTGSVKTEQKRRQRERPSRRTRRPLRRARRTPATGPSAAGRRETTQRRTRPPVGRMQQDGAENPRRAPSLGNRARRARTLPGSATGARRPRPAESAAMTGPPPPCADCGGPHANVHNHHYRDDVDGPLCSECFTARTANERAENRANGLCRCGAPVSEGSNPRSGKPWASCTTCRETRNQRDRNRRQDQRDRETLYRGKRRGWHGTGVTLTPENLDAFDEARQFMQASANLRNRSRDRYKQRWERRFARDVARRVVKNGSGTGSTGTTV